MVTTMSEANRLGRPVPETDGQDIPEVRATEPVIVVESQYLFSDGDTTYSIKEVVTRG